MLQLTGKRKCHTAPFILQPPYQWQRVGETSRLEASCLLCRVIPDFTLYYWIVEIHHFFSAGIFNNDFQEAGTNFFKFLFHRLHLPWRWMTDVFETQATKVWDPQKARLVSLQTAYYKTIPTLWWRSLGRSLLSLPIWMDSMKVYFNYIKHMFIFRDILSLLLSLPNFFNDLPTKGKEFIEPDKQEIDNCVPVFLKYI